jgi:hypothetical protein
MILAAVEVRFLGRYFAEAVIKKDAATVAPR